MGVEYKYREEATISHLGNIQVNDVVVQEGAGGTVVGLGDIDSMPTDGGLRKSV